MPELEFEIEVWCTCGNGLCNLSEVKYSSNTHIPQLIVQPCPDCIGKLEDEIEDLKYQLTRQEENSK